MINSDKVLELPKMKTFHFSIIFYANLNKNGNAQGDLYLWRLQRNPSSFPSSGNAGPTTVRIKTGEVINTLKMNEIGIHILGYLAKGNQS